MCELLNTECLRGRFVWSFGDADLTGLCCDLSNQLLLSGVLYGGGLGPFSRSSIHLQWVEAR